ncbi:BTB domain-containing protein [Meloidogyne graminicola]|uniref:BTB domain-containing protein n=1 Tax=Meloidogyne graminicola TaxID=189291 RepID=A0A8S9ZUA2_9BILA|nr:BTB domain-containing protein [Meloidogyne graminicola]
MGPNGLNDLVNTKYRIYASVDGTNVDIARSTHKFENQEKLGYTQISLSKLLPSNGHSDSLFLRCDVEIDYYNSNDNLVNIYSGILEQETFTDCLVKIGNQIINTHRYILAQNSEVFYNMFKKNNGMIEAENSEVTISDTSPECFRAMLEFFYTGKINKSTLEKFVDDIFAIANKYQVELLKYECELFMASKIDVNNIVKYYNIIQLYGAPTLEKACKNYIQVNRNNFINSKEWKEIKDKYPELAIRSLEYVVNNSDNNNIIQQ